MHTFRAPGPLVERVREVAALHGQSLSDVIRRALEQYLQEKEGNHG